MSLQFDITTADTPLSRPSIAPINCPELLNSVASSLDLASPELLCDSYVPRKKAEETVMKNGLAGLLGVLQRAIAQAGEAAIQPRTLFEKMTHIPVETAYTHPPSMLTTLLTCLANVLRLFTCLQEYATRYKKDRSSVNKCSTNWKDFAQVVKCKVVRLVVAYVTRILAAIDTTELMQTVRETLRAKRAGDGEVCTVINHVQIVEDRKQFIRSGKLKKAIGEWESEAEWEREADRLLEEASTTDSATVSSLSDCVYSKLTSFSLFCWRGIDPALQSINLSRSSVDPEKLSRMSKYFSAYKELILLHIALVNQSSPECPQDRSWLLRSGIMQRWYCSFFSLISFNFPTVFAGTTLPCCQSATHTDRCRSTLFSQLEKLTRNAQHTHPDEGGFQATKVWTHQGKDPGVQKKRKLVHGAAQVTAEGGDQGQREAQDSSL